MEINCEMSLPFRDAYLIDVDVEDICGRYTNEGQMFDVDASSETRHLHEETHKIVKRGRRHLPRFPRHATRILEQWLIEHKDAPYAAHEQQDDLKARTGLKRSQIMNWFANARKRGKLELLQRRDTSRKIAQAQTEDELFSNVANLHPFMRWLLHGPESEAADLSAIQNAIREPELRGNARANLPLCGLYFEQVSSSTTNWQMYRKTCSSESSMEIRSYAANIKSVCSDEWPEPDGPAPAFTRASRRHRRRGTSIATHLDDELRRFQCTFCCEAFKKKHDWQRHENSQHLPLERWVCCPQECVHVDPMTSAASCMFCGVIDPDRDHFQGHGYLECARKPATERTFYRKDHLRQHLKLMHRGAPLRPEMERWKHIMSEIRSRCGFCGDHMSSWDARAEHLAEHYKNGVSMAEWRGSWGFEDSILAILQGAELPEARSLGRGHGYNQRKELYVGANARTGLAVDDCLANANEAVEDISTIHFPIGIVDDSCFYEGGPEEPAIVLPAQESSGCFVFQNKAQDILSDGSGVWEADFLKRFELPEHGMQWEVPALSECLTPSYDERSTFGFESAQSVDNFDVSAFACDLAWT